MKDAGLGTIWVKTLDRDIAAGEYGEFRAFHDGTEWRVPVSGVRRFLRVVLEDRFEKAFPPDYWKRLKNRLAKP